MRDKVEELILLAAAGLVILIGLIYLLFFYQPVI